MKAKDLSRFRERVLEAHAAGKDEDAIAKELRRAGVTPAHVRLMLIAWGPRDSNREEATADGR